MIKNKLEFLQVILLIFILFTCSSLSWAEEIKEKEKNPIITIGLNEHEEKDPNSLTKIEELGIEIEFWDGYKIVKSEGNTIILFGPLGGVLSPIPTDKKEHIYSLIPVEKESPTEIIAYLNEVNKKFGPIITVKPEVKNIGNLTVVKWTEGGSCEVRKMIVIGVKNNYSFHSNGCHKDRNYDFDYFEKTIKTLKFL